MNTIANKPALAKQTEDDPRWLAVKLRDASADGQFYYSVRTTGVYCKPSCAARTARPENVEFHANCIAAEQAGFRPCKRCKPDQIPLVEQHTATIANSCRLIESSENMPTLETLAQQAGLSTYYFHRLFKSITGLTPKSYAMAQRNKRIRDNLSSTTSITEAIFDAGYNANSRFYEKSNQVLGMTPSSYRAGGERASIHFAIGECSLGAILVASSELGVCAILIGDKPETLLQDLQDRFPRSNIIGGDIQFEQMISKVIGFIEAPRIGLNLPLDIRGTAFQQRVWNAIREIPAGTTVSYTDIANKIGAPKATRAVASACAANALAVAIPCHRVVRIDGGISGYRWGIDLKKSLLARESSQDNQK